MFVAAAEPIEGLPTKPFKSMWYSTFMLSCT